MDKDTYDSYVAQLKEGHMVVIGGRSALSEEQLQFAIRASQDSIPGDPEAADHTLETVIAENFEGKELADLQELAASLGLTVTGEEDKEALADAIRTVHLQLQKKP